MNVNRESLVRVLEGALVHLNDASANIGCVDGYTSAATNFDTGPMRSRMHLAIQSIDEALRDVEEIISELQEESE